MNLQENDKWTRKEAELSKYKLLKEISTKYLYIE